MKPAAVAVTIALALPLMADQRIQKVLDRLAEEAAAFAQVAPNLIAEETLHQKAVKAARHRFRQRIEAPGAKPAGPLWQEREIRSEYAFMTAGEPPVIHEIRKVLSVDGKTVSERQRAVKDLAAALRASDDKARRALLEDFEKHGLVGTVADFGQLLMLFGHGSPQRYEFSFKGSQLAGAEQCDVIVYRQIEGPGALTVWDGKESARPQVTGEIWVAQVNDRPVRITMVSSRGAGAGAVRDEAEVDYEMSSHAVLVPVAITHREYRNATLTAENHFTYGPFRRFGASAEIKFTEEPKP